jgi:hypothetical protein
MRDTVSDPRLRLLLQEGTGQDRRPSCFWNAKARLYAHAVSVALAGESAKRAFKRFELLAKIGSNHEAVNRFAYRGSVKGEDAKAVLVSSSYTNKYSTRYFHFYSKSVRT